MLVICFVSRNWLLKFVNGSLPKRITNFIFLILMIFIAVKGKSLEKRERLIFRMLKYFLILNNYKLSSCSKEPNS